jgi:hypothetical protein
MGIVKQTYKSLTGPPAHWTLRFLVEFVQHRCRSPANLPRHNLCQNLGTTTNDNHRALCDFGPKSQAYLKHVY